jgi:hypothetical protein
MSDDGDDIEKVMNSEEDDCEESEDYDDEEYEDDELMTFSISSPSSLISAFSSCLM